MDLFQSMGGVLEVELTSAEPEQAIAAFSRDSGEIDSIRYVSDLTRRFRVRRQDYSHIAALAQRRGDSIKILRKSGLFWAGKQLLKRPVLVIGVLSLFALSLFLPSRILFVRVEGNVQVPSRKILAAAEECGIAFGASRKAVRSEKVKNALLSAVPELQWAGVNTAGSVATISVQERAQEERLPKSNEVTSIVASRDGFILSGTVTRGNALFQPGQAVKAGQVLISGYTDCGICIQATRAEGEIMAQTSRDLTAVSPAQRLKRVERTKVTRNISLLFQKKRINLWKGSGIWDGTCGRIETQYHVTLPGGFQLPITLCVEEISFYETVPSTAPAPEVQAALSAFSGRYLRRQMVAGSIQSAQQQFALADGCYRMEGHYVCEEMIGRERREQIGETNGENR